MTEVWRLREKNLLLFTGSCLANLSKGFMGLSETWKLSVHLRFCDRRVGVTDVSSQTTPLLRT